MITQIIKPNLKSISDKLLFNIVSKYIQNEIIALKVIPELGYFYDHYDELSYDFDYTEEFRKKLTDLGLTLSNLGTLLKGINTQLHDLQNNLNVLSHPEVIISKDAGNYEKKITWFKRIVNKIKNIWN